MSDTYEMRVLVVDDSEFFAQMTAETLTEEHDMDAAYETSALAALERLDDREVDCIVSDYQMPDMNGLELLDRVRQDHPSLPFILLTGRGDEETASDAIAAGVADYLLKLEVIEDKQYGRLANRIESVVSQDRTRRKFESLVNNSPDGIMQLTVDGEILTVNPTMANWLGTDPAQMTGVHLTDVMDPSVARRRIVTGQEAVEDDETRRMQDSIDGNYYQNQFVPVDSYRKNDTIQLVSRDVTERVHREQELQRQNERLEKFASVVSHDLRNPLNVAEGAIALLDPDPENEDLIAKIDRSLDRMGAIIEDVLTLARQGQTVDEPETVEIEELVRETWQWVETDGSTLEIEDSGELEADAGRIQDLFANLFRNAVEHNEGPVTVTVGTVSESGTRGIYVADDGVGIDVTSENIFEVGYSSSETGTGMGLSIVSQIAQAHNWTVDVVEDDSGGARFEITGIDTLN